MGVPVGEGLKMPQEVRWRKCRHAAIYSPVLLLCVLALYGGWEVSSVLQRPSKGLKHLVQKPEGV